MTTRLAPLRRAKARTTADSSPRPCGPSLPCLPGVWTEPQPPPPVRSNFRTPAGAVHALVHFHRCCRQECPRAGKHLPALRSLCAEQRTGRQAGTEERNGWPTTRHRGTVYDPGSGWRCAGHNREVQARSTRGGPLMFGCCSVVFPLFFGCTPVIRPERATPFAGLVCRVPDVAAQGQHSWFPGDCFVGR